MKPPIPITTAAIGALAVLFTWALAPKAAAQEGSLTVEWINSSSFSVEFEGMPGVTKQEAGSAAMARACEIAREHNFTHLGVQFFRMNEHVQAVQTQRGQTTARMGADGRPTDVQTTHDQYRAVRSGWATLNVTMMNQGGVELFQRSTDIINAGTCQVQSNRQ